MSKKPHKVTTVYLSNLKPCKQQNALETSDPQVRHTELDGMSVTR